MTKGKAIALAVFTIWPLVYSAFLFCVFFAMMISALRGAGNKISPDGWFDMLMVVHFATMLELMALLVIYVCHLFKNDRVPRDMKALWAIVIFFGSVIAMPVYWYMYIWREPEAPH